MAKKTLIYIGKEEEDECSYDPTEEFAAFLEKMEKDILAGRNLIRFDSNDEATTHLKKLINKKRVRK